MRVSACTGSILGHDGPDTLNLNHKTVSRVECQAAEKNPFYLMLITVLTF